MHAILRPSVFWKIWRRGALNFISGGGGSNGLDPALFIQAYSLHRVKAKNVFKF